MWWRLSEGLASIRARDDNWSGGPSDFSSKLSYPYLDSSRTQRTSHGILHTIWSLHPARQQTPAFGPFCNVQVDLET